MSSAIGELKIMTPPENLLKFFGAHTLKFHSVATIIEEDVHRMNEHIGIDQSGKRQRVL